MIDFERAAVALVRAGDLRWVRQCSLVGWGLARQVEEGVNLVAVHRTLVRLGKGRKEPRYID